MINHFLVAAFTSFGLGYGFLCLTLCIKLSMRLINVVIAAYIYYLKCLEASLSVISKWRRSTSFSILLSWLSSGMPAESMI